MNHKSFQILDTKALDDTGTFEALVSVFNNVDVDGERVVPGAFTKSLERWRESGDPIPVILSHQWNDVMAHIGYAYPDDVHETEKGLQVKGHLDVDDNPVARQVYKLMKRRSLKEFSFGFPRGAKRTRAKDGVYDLSDIDLAEFGPTFKGANAETELHAVKSALVDHGDVPLEPRSEQELRRATERAERDRVAPEIVPGAEMKVAEARIAGLRAELKDAEVWAQEAAKPKPQPRSEQELRRESESVDRERAAMEIVSDAEVKVAEAKVAELRKELEAAEAQAQEVTKPEPRSEASLRRAAERVERERAEKQLADIPDAPESTEEDAEPPEQEAAKPEPREESTLRRESESVERERVEKQLVGAPAVLESTEVGPSLADLVAELSRKLDQTAADIQELRRQPAEPDLRQESEAVHREQAEKALADTPVPATVIQDQYEQIQALTRQVEELTKALPVEPRSDAELRAASRDIVTERVRGEIHGLVHPDELTATAKALSTRELLEPDELEGMENAILKAVWTAAYVNDLPDSAFLYVKSGGTKDSEGKTTPRALRYFPYKDASGTVDLPHIRNALARIPQSNLPASVKTSLTTRATRILDNNKSNVTDVDEAAIEPRSTESDLRKRSLQTALEVQIDGVSKRRPPEPAQPEPPKPPSEAELRRSAHQQMLALLTGDTQ